MSGLREFLKTIFDTAKEALRQMELAAPHYWDDTIAVIARVALLALVLFAAVLFAQLMILLVSRKKDMKKIAAFAGTLAVVLALYAWAHGPLSDKAGDVSLVWGTPAESSSVGPDVETSAETDALGA